jgi:hypothetical protein
VDGTEFLGLNQLRLSHAVEASGSSEPVVRQRDEGRSTVILPPERFGHLQGLHKAAFGLVEPSGSP